MAQKSKRKKRKTPLNDLVRFQIKALAKFGFSHRYISSLVFHKRAAKVSESEIICVRSFCYRNELRVSDWRNGISPISRQYGLRGLKPKRRRKRRLKVMRTKRVAA